MPCGGGLVLRRVWRAEGVGWSCGGREGRPIMRIAYTTYASKLKSKFHPGSFEDRRNCEQVKSFRSLVLRK